MFFSVLLLTNLQDYYWHNLYKSSRTRCNLTTKQLWTWTSFFQEHSNSFSSFSLYNRNRILKQISNYFQQQVSATQDCFHNNIKGLNCNIMHSNVRYNASHYSVEQSNPHYSCSLLLVTKYALSVRVVFSIRVFGRKYSLNSLWSCLELVYTVGQVAWIGLFLCVSFFHNLIFPSGC